MVREKEVAKVAKLDDETPAKAWLYGALAWFVPGLGHLVQGRWQRGLLLGGAVWLMAALGFYWGGHLFPLGGTSGGTYLDIFWSLMNLGLGGIYAVCWAAGWGLQEHPQLLTFEYGETFLKVAGLLNYLVMLDAFDVAVGRKS